MAGEVMVGLEGAREDQESTNLGDRTRDHGAIYVNGNVDLFEIYMLNAGVRVDSYSDFETQYSPEVGLAVIPQPDIKLRLSAGHSFRIPNFTELYYDSPANQGNADLSPEEANSIEAGIDFGLNKDMPVDISLTVFRMEQKDIIDWIKDPPSAAQYQAQNITRANIKGFESRIGLRPVDYISGSLAYSYIDSDIKKEGTFTSKYALNHPIHQVNASVSLILPLGTQRVNMLYKDKKTERDYFLLDLHFSVTPKEDVEIYLDILNLTDENYEEVAGIPMPGISYFAGVKTEF